MNFNKTPNYSMPNGVKKPINTTTPTPPAPLTTAPTPSTPPVTGSLSRLSAASVASHLRRMSTNNSLSNSSGGASGAGNVVNSSNTTTTSNNNTNTINSNTTNNNKQQPPPPPPQSAKPTYLSGQIEDSNSGSSNNSTPGKSSPVNTPLFKKPASVNLSSSYGTLPSHSSAPSSPSPSNNNFYRKPSPATPPTTPTPSNPAFKRSPLTHSASTSSLTSSTSSSPSPTPFNSSSPRSTTPPLPSTNISSTQNIQRPVAKKPALPPREHSTNNFNSGVNNNNTTTTSNSISIPQRRGQLPKPPTTMTPTSTINAKKFLKTVIKDKEDNSSDEEDDDVSSTSSSSSSASSTPRGSNTTSTTTNSKPNSASNSPATGSPVSSTPSSPVISANKSTATTSTAGSSAAATPSSSSATTTSTTTKEKKKEITAADMTQRNYLAQEILSTEKKYINNLNRIITIFVLPLRDKSTSKDKILSVDEINSIFMNIETIFNIHKTFLTDFESRIDKWTDTQKIGDVFLKMAPYLRAYTVYSNSYNSSILLLSSLTKSNPNFATFLSKCLLKPASKGLNLSSYLIMPIQRIPRYKLLLENLIAKSPENHVDYTDLKEALTMISSVASELDERLLQFQIKHKVLDIQNSLVGMDEDIVKPTRVFYKEGDLKKISDRVVNTRHFFLFNDLLIYAQKESKSLYRFKHSFPLLQSWVKDLPDTQRFKYLFQIISPTKTYFLCAPSEADKQDWMKLLNEVINNLVQQNPDCETQRSSIYEKRGSMSPNEILKQLENSIPTEENESELRSNPIWLKDQMVKACMHCSSSFTMTRRRHHCRKCGKIFCNDCCPVTDLSQYLPGKKARICKACFEEISVQLTEMINHTPNDNNGDGSPSNTAPTSLNSSFNSQCSLDEEQQQ